MVPASILLARASTPGSRVNGANRTPSVSDQPLALAPVLNQPMVAYTLDELADAGITNTVVVAEREIAEEVTDALRHARAASTVAGVVEWEKGGCLLTAISEARQHLDGGPFALHLGDSLCRRDLSEQLDPDRELGDCDAVALMSRFNVPNDYATIHRTTTGRRVDPAAPGTGAYDAGVYLLGGDFPEGLEGSEERRIIQQIAAALDAMQDRGGHINRRYVTDWWCYRGQDERVLEMNRFVLARLEENGCEAIVIESDVQGAVQADSSACIESSVIRGPVVIGPDVVIKDAFVGPYSSIGAGARIEGAELEHSVILDGVEISHLGGRLESSVIGTGSKVSRDFRLPRGLRLSVGAGSNIALQ